MSKRYERNDKVRQAKQDTLLTAISNLNDAALDILSDDVREHTLNYLTGAGDPKNTYGYVDLTKVVVNTVLAELIAKGVVVVAPDFQTTDEELAELEAERANAQLKQNEYRNQMQGIGYIFGNPNEEN